MRIPFSDAGRSGQIRIDIARTGNPDEVGAGPGAADLPNCTATVDYPGHGYNAFFGWIQAVRSTDNATGGKDFEMDPLESLGSLPHPFCFAGHQPTLFDAPSRNLRANLEWTAYAFLCRGPEVPSFTAHALAGFSWGFTIEAGRITIAAPTALTPAHWNHLVPTLQDTYPTWQFPLGFHHS
jgi:hypothetical protein